MSRSKGAVPLEVRQLVLHEGGYKCANPACRHVLTLDIHHMEYVSEGGVNDAHNLLPLCPNCHTLHHKGYIPNESIRAWKQLLLSLNEGFDRRAVDILLLMAKQNRLFVSGEGVLSCAALVASDLVTAAPIYRTIAGHVDVIYQLDLTAKGQLLVDAWKRGDQRAVVELEVSFPAQR